MFLAEPIAKEVSMSLPKSLITPIPADKQDKRGWSVSLNGAPIPQVTELTISNPKFGVVAYGLTSPGYDGWSFHEIGGGGSVIVPYASIEKQLYIGVLEQARHNQGGKILNVPRGFLDPGESHFEAAKREFTEEVGVNAPVNVVSLPGEPMNPNSAFFETPEPEEGVKCFSVHFHSAQLEKSETGYRFRDGVVKPNAESKAAKLAEQILGCRFIPYAKALQLGDMFTVAAVGRLIGSIGISPQ
jgi:ADP-ribose pyrophosphatase YjhB (NUDIX family)